MRNLLILIFILLLAHSANSQNSDIKQTIYIKFEQSLTNNDINKITQLNSLKQKYTFVLKKGLNLTDKKIKTLSNTSKEKHSLKNIFKIETVLDNSETKQLITQLNKIKGVLYCYKTAQNPIPPPHDISPITSSFETNQTYIESDPGVNVRYAWNQGVNGTGINIKAIEYGVNLNHEDLDHQNISLAPNTTVNSGATLAYTEHGTSVAGVVFSNYGTYGTSGLAHNANEYILYPEWTQENNYDRVLAVTNAIQDSSPGDIIIYEMQTSGQNGNYVLAEFEQVIWDLTKAATDAGIVIVAAAGNGNGNLDDAFYTSYNNRGDSGAIIVGAGSANTSHSPLSYSSHGNRVNVQGWGQNVYTTGKTASTVVINNDLNQTYTTGFGGTSSATAVVGGFTAVLQSYYFQLTGNYLTSIQLRDIMVSTGIPQGAGKHIGPLPNMEAAMNQIDLSLSTIKFNTSNLYIGPNPTSDYINIKTDLNTTKKTTLILYNILGQEILKKELNHSNTKIDIRTLNLGIYILKLESGLNKIAKKIIIN